VPRPREKPTPTGALARRCGASARAVLQVAVAVGGVGARARARRRPSPAQDLAAAPQSQPVAAQGQAGAPRWPARSSSPCSSTTRPRGSAAGAVMPGQQLLPAAMRRSVGASPMSGSWAADRIAQGSWRYRPHQGGRGRRVGTSRRSGTGRALLRAANPLQTVGLAASLPAAGQPR